MTKYSRQSPSPRYRRLLQQYRQMHEEGEKHLGIPPELTFDGRSLPPQAPHIKRLVELTAARSILDYGSGKGRQYELPNIKSYWDVDEIRCYDPAYAPFSALPDGTFDGVVCTDVLEHCPEDDLPWIVGELFAFARKFVYANIACFPARKRLPSGGNAHCTVKPVKWWEERIAAAARGKPGLLYEFRLAHAKRGEIRESLICSTGSA